jgi:serine/threonine-protein kinase HipA
VAVVEDINWDAFFALHHNLPREGPGSDAMTEQVARSLPPLPAGAVLDIGCGPGRQTLVLARVLGHSVIAIDTHRPFLDRLDAAAEAAGLSTLIETRQQSLFTLPDEPDGVALIWAEGSIYVPGFAEGLRLWRRLLVPGGLIMASDAVWLTDDPPAEARRFWEEDEGLTLVTREARCREAEAEGFEVLGAHTLPSAAWWDDYYAPLSARAAELRVSADPAMIPVLDANDREIDTWRRFGDSYGYVYFVLRKRDDDDG